MNVYLFAAGILVAALGVAHSWLGERLLIRRLISSQARQAAGVNRLGAQTLRAAWHVTSVAWWGIAAILIAMALPARMPATAAHVVAVTSLASAGVMGIWTRGRHLSWVFFLVIAGLCWLGA